jgi:hypothetical protein
MYSSAVFGGNKKNALRAAIALAVLLTARPGWAGSIVVVGNGGTLTDVHSSRSNNHLSGNKMDITQIVTSSGVLPVLVGRMSFMSGALTGSKGEDQLFGPGGKLWVNGCVDLNRDADTKCGRGDLSGNLITAQFINATLVDKNGKFFLDAEVLESINPKLAAFLNLSKTTYQANLQLALIRLGRNRWDVEGGFLSMISEPASIVLAGLALLLLVVAYGWLRKSFSIFHLHRD